ncbi:MAG: hypothetical protein ACI9EZ_000927 [Halobacteriales archaeon]|jgi:hypothetical protein
MGWTKTDCEYSAIERVALIGLSAKDAASWEAARLSGRQPGGEPE